MRHFILFIKFIRNHQSFKSIELLVLHKQKKFNSALKSFQIQWCHIYTLWSKYIKYIDLWYKINFQALTKHNYLFQVVAWQLNKFIFEMRPWNYLKNKFSSRSLVH